MDKEEINELFKKYKVRIPKEKQGQSECKICKENHKFSLSWTCLLYEYKEHYYCYEHIVNILLQQENQLLKNQQKEFIEYLENYNVCFCGEEILLKYKEITGGKE